MEFDAPEDVKGEGGNFLDAPGTYHIVITDVKPGESQKGKPIDGFTFHFDVLAGTVDGCSGKSGSQSLFAPDLSKEQKSIDAAKRKLAAFFIATGVMTPDQLGKPVNIDESAANGKQLLVKFARKMEKDGEGNYTVETKFLEIHYSDIFHVDDPEVKDIPKNADALGMIETKDRHPDTWFAFKEKKAATKSAAAESTSSTEAPAEPVDVAGLF